MACAAHADAPPACAGAGAPLAAGRVARPELTEASGLAASRAHPGVLWSHNDHGGGAVLYALGPDGADLGAFTVPGVDARDWEDIAAGADAGGQAWIYVADIGDNHEKRDEVEVLRVPEPATLGADGLTGAAGRLRLRYPDHAHDAETLLVDPQDGSVYVLTKSKLGATLVFRTPGPGAFDTASVPTASPTPLVPVAALQWGTAALPGDLRLTGGDIAPDRSRLLLRTRDHVFVWALGTRSVAQALASPPCLAPAPTETQGEALAATAAGFRTVGEGAGSTVWAVELP